MPSLLNFKPLLDTYNPDAGQEGIRQGWKYAAAHISKNIEQTGARGRQRDKEFQSVFDLDVSKVADMESKKYLIREYDKLKRNYVAKYKGNKNILGYGKLTSEEQIDLRSAMDNIKSSAESVKFYDNQLVTASNEKEQDWGYVLDDKLKEEYAEAKNTGNTDAMAAFMQKTGTPINGNPFIKVDDVNVGEFVQENTSVIRKALETTKQVEKESAIRNGNIYANTTTTTKFGTEAQARLVVFNNMAEGESGKVLEANLMRNKELSDEQKQLAIKDWGGKTPFPLLKYYAENIADVSTIMADKENTLSSVSVDKTSEDYKKKHGTGSVIEQNEQRGYDYGMNVFRHTGTLTDKDGNTINVKSAPNTGIVVEGDKYYAKFSVSRDIAKEKMEIGDKIIKEKKEKLAEALKDVPRINFKQRIKLKEKINKEVNDKYKEEYDYAYDNAEKTKTILVPLWSVMGDLETKLDNAHISLRGFDKNKIDYPDDSNDGNDNSNDGNDDDFSDLEVND